MPLSRRAALAAALCALCSTSFLAVTSARAAGCAADAPGGDWPSYGHDAANTRSQPLEDSIDAQTVGSLTKQWTFAALDNFGAGAVTSTPVVAGGCVFVMSSVTNGAQLFALNADDGSLVWTSGRLPGGGAALGGAGVGSVAVAGGRVFAFVSKPDHPYAVAYDLAGHQLWGGGPLASGPQPGWVDDQQYSFINASAVVIPAPQGDLLFAGFSTEENQPDAGRGGWTIFDAATGAVLAHEYAISDSEFFDHGERGASVWATAAADIAGGFVYAATGNPASAQPEARAADSLLKIDVRDRLGATFGKVVAAYHGDPDSYLDALRRQPACDEAPDAVKVLDSWSVTCAQLDLDFGASPNLFTDDAGRLLVGDLQKSGTYHAVHTDTMAGAWRTAMGAPGFSFNGSSLAYDGVSALYGVGTPGGAMQSIGTGDGRLRWAQPVADGLHYQSTSTANGVVYVTDGWGFLNAWDATTGRPLLKRNIAQDTGEVEVNAGSGGVAIARHRLFVAVNANVVAYGR